ncbi:hypothetical protein JW756_05820 [Candidatus Woesearchaeota archaeon]|nr:hypothetical protein [Candidatus Woesearchaeota archaeon]
MGKKKCCLARNFLIIVSLIFILMFPNITMGAPDVVVANSADWKDVYSTLVYANLIGAQSYFLTSTPHGPILLYEINQYKQIQVITSADKPYVIGYDTIIRSKGYPDPEELVFDQANLELAKRLANITQFIIIDPSYGYNALAVAPYAVKEGYYVLFADDRNIGDIASFLSGKNVKNLMLYGRVDRGVRTALARYNPEIISSPNGSRFEDNIMIVDKYAEIGSIKQVILTNGEFIESSMLTGREPVLFIGKANVPDEIQNYIKSRDVQIGVLIGNELIGSATTIRRQLGISVFVKFARGSRIPGGTINPVEDLDRFPMPSYQLSMTIVSITYNKATGMLEVTYRNNVELATYFKSTITVRNADNETLAVVGDKDVIFIDGSETKTMTYAIDLSNQELEGNLTGEVFTIYGESKTSLEQAIRGFFKIETITVKDDTDIIILSLVYDKTRARFLVTIENIGNVDVYVDVELQDLWVNGEYVTVSADDIVKIGAGEKKTIPVKIKLEDEDLESEKNSEITVHAVFGERKHALIKSKIAKFALQFKKAEIWYYIVIAVILLLLLFIFLIARRRKRCPRCRTMNNRNARHCKKCGHEFGRREDYRTQN